MKYFHYNKDSDFTKPVIVFFRKVLVLQDLSYENSENTG